jgi:hypothetical protein
VERVAHCHCGSLRAVLTGEPERVYLCHCQACQHRTGAIFHSGAYCRREQVRTEGPFTEYVRQAASGLSLRFHFCPTCGSSVYWSADHSPEYVGIAVGCFADPNFPPPSVSGWEESMAKWFSMPSCVEERYQQRTNIGTAIKKSVSS